MYYDFNNQSEQFDQNQTNGQEPQRTTGQNGNRKPKKAMKIIATVLALTVLATGSFQGYRFIADHVQRTQTVSTDNNDAQNGQSQNQEDFAPQVENNALNTEISSVDTSKFQNASTTDQIVTDVSDVVESVMPSIVSIVSTIQTTYNIYGQQYSQDATGSGSGIIIGQNNSEVLIATNNHVIANASAIEITFVDQTTAQATLKGTEVGSDLAVVAVKLSDLSESTKDTIQIATLGNSDDLRVGEMAIAIGNALGYGQSMTVGYISALNREVSTEDYTMYLLQTDAAINPGNSGGALINIYGEVIGINSAKYASSEVEGMGFAIPISTAIPIINDLMNREIIPENEQAYLGIVGSDITKQEATAYNIPMGVLIRQVSDGSPADKAGLQASMVITEFDGKTITSMSDLQAVLATYRAGTSVQVNVKVYNRKGTFTDKKIEVTLGNRPVSNNTTQSDKNE